MNQAGAGLEPGAVLLGKYRVESVLGRGGMGLVVRAMHVALDEPVAIKILRDDIAIDHETLARFLHEAQSAVKLKSEHVARVLDVGKFPDGKPYMVMEFLEGQDLSQMLLDHGKLHPPLAVEFVLQACDALGEAHSLGFVHRDIKPTNLFVTWRVDGTALVKVLDFGIAKSMASAELSLTQTQSMLGTPAYMSPEQMRSARTVDARTDIWSIGAVLYELVEGHRPFHADSFSEMCVKVAADPPIPMVAAPALQAVITRCLAKRVEDRYANVAELARDLAVFARDPQQARTQAERMQRTLGRRGSEWSVESQPAAMAYVAADSGPVAMQLATTGTGPVKQAPSPPSLIETSTGVMLARARGRGRRIAVIALAATVIGAIAIAVIGSGSGSSTTGNGSGSQTAGSGEPRAASGEPRAASGEPRAASGEPRAAGGEPRAASGDGSAVAGSGSGSAVAGSGNGSAVAVTNAAAGVGSASSPPAPLAPKKKLPIVSRPPPKPPVVVEPQIAPPPDKPSLPVKKPCDVYNSRVAC